MKEHGPDDSQILGLGTGSMEFTENVYASWNQKLFFGHVKFESQIQAEILCLQVDI